MLMQMPVIHECIIHHHIRLVFVHKNTTQTNTKHNYGKYT